MNRSIACFLGIIQVRKVDAELASPSVPLDSNKAKTRLEHSKYQSDRHNIWCNGGLGCAGTDSMGLQTEIAICAIIYRRPDPTLALSSYSGKSHPGERLIGDLETQGGRTFVG